MQHCSSWYFCSSYSSVTFLPPTFLALTTLSPSWNLIYFCWLHSRQLKSESSENQKGKCIKSKNLWNLFDINKLAHFSVTNRTIDPATNCLAAWSLWSRQCFRHIHPIFFLPSFLPSSQWPSLICTKDCIDFINFHPQQLQNVIVVTKYLSFSALSTLKGRLKLWRETCILSKAY